MINREAWNGSITVFLSLVCILFLALICAAAESARIQGARAQSANITGMGTFSLLGEFEPDLLEKYEIFSVDGGQGGAFQIQKVNGKLENYLKMNTSPKKGLQDLMTFDPWNLELQECKVTGYALLTDDNGEAFYQQAVSYMEYNLGTLTLEKLRELSDTTEIEKNQKEYENGLKDYDKKMAEVEEQQQAAIETMEEDGTALSVPAESVENPLPAIAKLGKKKILNIVAGDKNFSQKRITKSGLPSGSRLRKGTMKIEKKKNVFADILFREYLLRFFPNYRDEKSGAALDYQLEYILCGKKSDQENMKQTVRQLLLLRECMNFVSSDLDEQLRSEANALAGGIALLIPIPVLHEAVQAVLWQALLLAWSFGESLVDLRILLDGGKVPLMKTSRTWNLKLENLGKVAEIMTSGVHQRAGGEENGILNLSYSDYLRLLLNLGRVSNQRMRALDMIQLEMRQKDGMESFKAENCIVAVETSATYQCRPVFSSLPGAVLGVFSSDQEFTQTASMAY